MGMQGGEVNASTPVLPERGRENIRGGRNGPEHVRRRSGSLGRTTAGEPVLGETDLLYPRPGLRPHPPPPRSRRRWKAARPSTSSPTGSNRRSEQAKDAAGRKDVSPRRRSEGDPASTSRLGSLDEIRDLARPDPVGGAGSGCSSISATTLPSSSRLTQSKRQARRTSDTGYSISGDSRAKRGFSDAEESNHHRQLQHQTQKGTHKCESSSVNTFLTLDRVMQAPGGPEEDPSGGFEHGGSSFGYRDEQMQEAMGEFMSKPFDLVLGREDLRDLRRPSGRIATISASSLLNKATKHVASTTLTPSRPSGRTSKLIEGAVPDGVRALKQENRPELQVHGSANLHPDPARARADRRFPPLDLPARARQGKAPV